MEYTDPKQDAFMRTAVPLVVSTGEKLGKQSRDPFNPLYRYRPVWNLEAEIRAMMKVQQPKVSRYSSQLPEDIEVFDSFDPERLRKNNAQFLRNVMHYLILLTTAHVKRSPDATQNTLAFAAIHSAESLEVAAQYPNDIQRAAMGVPGKHNDDLRKKRKIDPEIYFTGGKYVIRRLEDNSYTPSLCSGTILIKTDSSEIKKTPIAHLTEFAVERVAPFTLWKDIPHGNR